MKQKPLIIWEKWRDPFGEKNDDDLDLDIDSEEFDDNTYNEIESEEVIAAKVLLTPMGLIPYNDNTASSKIFNFWLGHTNFDITQSVFDILDSANGIETLDVFTRYRFRIGIGKAFDDRKIMRKLNDKIYSHLNEQNQYDDSQSE